MSQKITYAKIENFKWIESFEAKDFWRFVAIFWANGVWKTSFLEAIKSAIKLEKGWNSKVRIWEEQWSIEVHFEDFKIKRLIWTKTKLEVEHNGELVNRPQEWLDWVFQWTIGDPNKFLSLHNKEKIKYILETHWKQTEYEKLESERLEKYELRKNIHRTLLAKEEEIKNTNTDWFDSIEEPTESMAQLQEELNQAQLNNAKIVWINNEIILRERGIWTFQKAEEWYYERLKWIDEEVQRLMKEKEKIQWYIESNKKDITRLENEKQVFENNKQELESIDTTPILAKIAEYTKKQENIANIKAKKWLYESQLSKVDEMRIERKQQDEEVKAIEQQQNSLIDWLDVSYKMKLEDWTLYIKEKWKRIALDEMNTASQIDFAIDVCLSWPNQVKIITIENANSLDPKTMQKVKEKIEEKEWQCFLETVYKTDFETITITNA